MKRELSILLGAWLVLAAILFGVGWQSLSAPGLNYDEAIYGGLANDFLAGHATGGHMPGVHNLEIFGRPFPLFVQPYLGALKCWMLIPAFKLFGSTVATMRGTNLFLCVVALLICMLWVWRLLGLVDALIAGLLLASDPAFLFAGELDWGSALPSVLCRVLGLFLALLAWRRQNARLALAAGLVFGLGFFNKIDFGVFIAGTALAALYAGGKSIGPVWRTRPAVFLYALLGFLVTAGLALASLGGIFRTISQHHDGAAPSQYPEKLHTLFAMYDGSYFYRLMAVGGQFDKMYRVPSNVWTPFGIVVLMAAIVLVVDIIFSTTDNPARRAKLFLLLSGIFVTLGMLILPGAVRIHHTSLVYPFPQVLVACAVTTIWRRRPKFAFQRMACALAAVLGWLVVIGNCMAVQRTQVLIHATGGRGWWSNELMRFAAENNTRTDVTVASLDWGFNEQLEFLTHGPRLGEPFWLAAAGTKPELPQDPHFIYLVHPPDYSLSPFGGQFMESVERENTNAIVRTWRDGQGHVAFYSITFKALK